MNPPDFMDALDTIEELAGKLSRMSPEESDAALEFLRAEIEIYRGQAASNVIDLNSRRNA